MREGGGRVVQDGAAGWGTVSAAVRANVIALLTQKVKLIFFTLK